MALNRLLGKENVECVGISEIDKYALMSYEAIHGDLHNYGDITKINGKDLPEIDILTWSFPCQDLSKAGQQKGLNNTRSGLGYEVIRIVEEMEVKPKVLLMENVPDLLSQKFTKGWHLMFNEIEKLGYSNYVEILNAKNYGVAQNRNRVFMVSILGKYTYTYPKKIRLKKKLKDYLEANVDEKYYLSDKMLAYLTDMTNRNGFVRGKRFKPHELDSEYAYAITTNTGNRPTDNFIILPEATKKGFTEARLGDGVYTNSPHQKRGVVQKDKIQTIKTSVNDIGVVVKDTRETIYSDKSVDKILSNIVDVNGVSKTITANPQRATIDSATLVVATNPPLKIRKLTPLEAWRLMGIDDEDFHKAKATGMSDSQLYKQAGNAIVVDVLYYLFKNMF